MKYTVIIEKGNESGYIAYECIGIRLLSVAAQMHYN